MTKIRTGQITPSSEAWTSYTPTLTNISGGTLTASYLQIGKTVFVYFKYVFAGAGVAGTPRFTLPVAANTKYQSPSAINTELGKAFINDAGTQNYFGVCIISSATGSSAVDIYVHNMAGLYQSITGISSTVPMTWASGDTITAQLIYEAA